MWTRKVSTIAKTIEENKCSRKENTDYNYLIKHKTRFVVRRVILQSRRTKNGMKWKIGTARTKQCLSHYHPWANLSVCLKNKRPFEIIVKRYSHSLELTPYPYHTNTNTNTNTHKIYMIQCWMIDSTPFCCEMKCNINVYD